MKKLEYGDLIRYEFKGKGYWALILSDYEKDEAKGYAILELGDNFDNYLIFTKGHKNKVTIHYIGSNYTTELGYIYYLLNEPTDTKGKQERKFYLMNNESPFEKDKIIDLLNKPFNRKEVIKEFVYPLVASKIINNEVRNH